MNKYKKIVTAVVATVMAGTMVFSLSACGKTTPTENNNPEEPTLDASYTPTTDSNGKLSYASGTTVTLGIGYSDKNTGITYSEENASDLSKKNATVMGVSVSQSTLKPAWSALQTKLDITISDKYTGNKTSANLSGIKNTAEGLAGTALFTASLSTVSTEQATNKSILNLADYLDYMPNYKAFLESSPVIQMSLLSDDGSMYIAPYFDGNDDIEKYVIMRKDIVEEILVNELPTVGDATFAVQNASASKPKGATQASVTSYMGTSGSWTVDTTDPSALTGTPAYGNDKVEVTSNNTVKVKVDYDAAKTAANTSDTALNTALKAAYSGFSSSDSGNIIDLQNVVINGTSGTVTGTQLINILRAYIDVAYTTESGGSFYVSSNGGLTRAGVFNSASAAWDVDLYVALGRCYVASGTMFSGYDATVPQYLISGRTNTDQRQTDMVALVGELYGVRGLESRDGNYSYINSNGEIADARNSEATWDAMNAFAALTAEGLVNTTLSGGDYSLSMNYGTLSLHDYVQTQTKYGFTNSSTNFTPILTPVSNWDTDDNGEKDTIMRFTESWRGVKTDGVAVSKAAVKDKPDVLAAVLTMIDYMYSPDGQILMTYGPMSTNGNTNPNGLWYATEADKSVTEVADVAVEATNYTPTQYTLKEEYIGTYFVYDGKVYSGTYYNGKMIPTMTDEAKNVLSAVAGYNYTNCARKYFGATLPVDVKDQGFEYQCTSDMGKVGADIVAVALVNGTIKHQYQTIDSDNYWYTLCPTNFPYSTRVASSLASGNLALLSGKGGDDSNLFSAGSGTNQNWFLQVIFYGFGSTKSVTINSVVYTVPANATAAVTKCNELGLSSLITFKNQAWEDLLDWYDANK